MGTPLRLVILCSRSPADRELRAEFEVHLAALVQAGLIAVWHDALCLPGQEASQQTALQLEQADLVTPLISADFFAAPSCQRALDRAMGDGARDRPRIVPILVRPVEWSNSPAHRLFVLPAPDRPVTAWTNRDEAWAETVGRLRLLSAGAAAPDASAAGGRWAGVSRRLRRYRSRLLTFAVLMSALVGLQLCRHAPLSKPAVPQPLVRVPPASSERSARPGMVALRGGRMEMGSTRSEIVQAYESCRRSGEYCRPDIYEREQPVRVVRLGPYLLDRTEVTNAQLANWLQERASTLRITKDLAVYDRDGVLLVELGDRHSGIRYTAEHGFSSKTQEEAKPVVLVTWDGAFRYCNSYGKRLPSEAEWEFAARGEQRRRFPWGKAEPACSGVVFGRQHNGACTDGYGAGPEAVGRSPQDVTLDGIFDLGGNVKEWVLDEFIPGIIGYPDCGPACLGPVVSNSGASTHVQRGGSYYQGAYACRGAGRSRAARDQTSFNVGFRCAASLKDAPSTPDG